jgi:PAS domain S-box-containing protein
MTNARVLVVGTPADCDPDPGDRALSVDHEASVGDAIGRVKRTAEEYDYVVCAATAAEAADRLADMVACPVLERVPDGSVTLDERVDRLVDSFRTDGGVMRGSGPGLSATLRERAVDAAPLGVTIADARLEDVPLVYVNDGFERLTGYSTGEVLGRNCRLLQGPETDPKAVARFTDALTHPQHRIVELLNYRKDGTPFWNRVELAPVEDDRGEVTHFVGFQTDVTARREAEGSLERERRHLETLLERVNGLLGDVTAAVMQASTRPEVERALVERLAAGAEYRGAWVAVPDLGRERFEAGESAGVDPPASLGFDEDHPVAQAYESGDLVVASGGEAGADGARLVALPLVYRETTYAVCCVHAVDDRGVGEHGRAVLRALGRAAATAVHAIEGRRLLGSDTVTEMELRLGSAFPAGVATRLDATFEYQGAVFEDDRLRTFYSVAGAEPATVTAATSDDPAVVGCRAVTTAEDGEEALFEFAVAPDSLVSGLADRGAGLRRAMADVEGLRVVVDLPAAADKRAFVESLRAHYGEVTMISTRERRRRTRTTPEFREALESRLTERQLTALRLAHVGGYFAPHRRASGDELADAMGVSRSTFHQHLRAAQRKLVAGFLDPADT